MIGLPANEIKIDEAKDFIYFYFEKVNIFLANQRFSKGSGVKMGLYYKYGGNNMGFLKRALLNVTRKPGKSGILALLVFVLESVLAGPSPLAGPSAARRRAYLYGCQLSRRCF